MSCCSQIWVPVEVSNHDTAHGPTITVTKVCSRVVQMFIFAANHQSKMIPALSCLRSPSEPAHITRAREIERRDNFLFSFHIPKFQYLAFSFTHLLTKSLSNTPLSRRLPYHNRKIQSPSLATDFSRQSGKSDIKWGEDSAGRCY